MSLRVQVILSEEERELFRRLAKEEGLSLSAWIRKAGLERASASSLERGLRSREELDAFFSLCDETEVGREPEWEEHLAVIERSKREGLGGAG